ncbi:MAG TPA: GNAT family N-acetyltransferase [Burkholderiales bacterium]|nr:GNAT family N-acetyltransferase [Burkholderiales bacterium]
MAEYPQQLVREHRLSDGRTVTIRPVRPGDADRVREFLTALSEESRYMRFQKWVRAPSDKVIRFLTEIDYDLHMALVCTVQEGGREVIVGEARYVSDLSGRSCELGIVIADAWHKSGIAGLLMGALIETARKRGLPRMEGFVLARNAEMLRFVRALGFEAEPAPQDYSIVRISKTLREGTREA